jgi:hypothetical protein
MPAWIIPIVEEGREVGQVVVPAQGEVLVTGLPSLAWKPSPPPELLPELRKPQEAPQVEITTHSRDKLQAELEKARERGRAIYRQAVALSQETGMPLSEALYQVGEETL